MMGGVVDDIPRIRGQEYFGSDKPIKGWDLQNWATAIAIKLCDGDAVLIRSGAEKYWIQDPDLKLSFPPNTRGNTPSVIEYLYNTNAVLLGWYLQESGH